MQKFSKKMGDEGAEAVAAQLADAAIGRAAKKLAGFVWQTVSSSLRSSFGPFRMNLTGCWEHAACVEVTVGNKRWRYRK